MAASFDWEFDQDTLPPQQSNQGPPIRNRRRRWLWQGGVAIVLLVIVGLIVRVWLTGQLRVADEMEKELRNLVQLELKSIADGDAELFRSLQDPADPTWQELQMERFFSTKESGSPPAPGLTPANRASDIKEVHFSGHRAQVELTRWFQSTLLTSDPSTPTLPSAMPFQVVWFYRRENNGTWYHITPPDDYQDIPYSWHGTWLDIYATEVQAQTLDTIAHEFSGLITQACRLLHCPADTHYTLRFKDVSAPQLEGGEWALPALFMAGQPENKQALDAWAQALKPWLIEALIQTQIDDERIADRILYRQLLARLLVTLNLPTTSVGEPVVPDVELLTQALHNRGYHERWRLWGAKYDPNDAGETRLYETEIAAMLDFIEIRVGPQELFALLPVLNRYHRFSDALAVLYDLGLEEFKVAWADYVSKLTDTPITAYALENPTHGSSYSFIIPQPIDQPLGPPPPPLAPPTPPGDHIALNCQNRIWVGNADGTDLAALTPFGLYFSDFHWSPDGRWLLTAWQHSFGSEQIRSVPYLLAADGNESRLPTNNPAISTWPATWSPDGRQAVYLSYTTAIDGSVLPEIWAVDVETDETYPLPGFPIWSPNEKHLAYFTAASESSPNAVLLADADWNNAYPIAEGFLAGWFGLDWSPDSRQLALAIQNEGGGEKSIVIYDLETAQLTPLITMDELTAAVLSAGDEIMIGDADPTLLTDKPLEQFMFGGWSPDGQQLLVAASANLGNFNERGVLVLAVVPVDGSAPRVLVYQAGNFIREAAWSPTNPDKLVLTVAAGNNYPMLYRSYLVDLSAGPIYTAPASVNIAWSPDGDWVALVKEGQIIIIDQEGREHFSFAPAIGGQCNTVAWNPAADLNGLSDTPQ